jgi:hypothetical protein
MNGDSETQELWKAMEMAEIYEQLPVLPRDFLAEGSEEEESRVLEMLEKADPDELSVHNMEGFLRRLPQETRIYRGSDFEHQGGLNEDWTFLINRALTYAKSDYSGGEHMLPLLEETTVGELLKYEERVLNRINELGQLQGMEINKLVGIGNSNINLKETSGMNLKPENRNGIVFPKRQYRVVV